MAYQPTSGGTILASFSQGAGAAASTAPPASMPPAAMPIPPHVALATEALSGSPSVASSPMLPAGAVGSSAVSGYNPLMARSGSMSRPQAYPLGMAAGAAMGAAGAAFPTGAMAAQGQAQGAMYNRSGLLGPAAGGAVDPFAGAQGAGYIGQGGQSMGMGSMGAAPGIGAHPGDPFSAGAGIGPLRQAQWQQEQLRKQLLMQQQQGYGVPGQHQLLDPQGFLLPPELDRQSSGTGAGGGSGVNVNIVVRE